MGLQRHPSVRDKHNTMRHGTRFVTTHTLKQTSISIFISRVSDSDKPFLSVCLYVCMSVCLSVCHVVALCLKECTVAHRKTYSAPGKR